MTIRHIQGTGFIAFGPGSQAATQPTLCQTHTHQHHHNHDQNRQDHVPNLHFWGIIHSPPTNSLLLLKGVPQPLGTYPSDMPKPHGCIPPHLYYSVTLHEHTLDLPHLQSLSPTSTLSPTREWILPYVHRLGNGHDDAGGLTSHYHPLAHTDDADDFGVFIQQMLHPSTTTSDSSTPAPSTAPPPPSLYACTDTLISETKTLSALQSQFFDSWYHYYCNNNSSSNMHGAQSASATLPPILQELQQQILSVQQTYDLDDLHYNHPFSLCISDIQLALP